MQELEALKRIREIIADLGGIDSCVGMALEGCFEIAEDNIKNDFDKKAETSKGFSAFF